MKLKQKVTDVEVIIGNCFPEVGEIGPWKYFKLSEIKIKPTVVGGIWTGSREAILLEARKMLPRGGDRQTTV